MTTIAPIDQRWYSAHRPILFGADMPFYPQGYVSVADDGNGKAIFTRSNALIYPYADFSLQFYVDAGPYTGFHSVVSYDPITEEILTTTDFVGNDPTPPAVIRNFYQVVPFGYRVYYGYPTQTNTFDVRAFHKPDATAYVDISSILANSFLPHTPEAGYDEDMYTYFKIDYIPLGEFADFLTTYSLTINTFTLWNYTLETYYCLNSAITHNKLQDIVANDKFLCETDPIFFTDCCNVFSKVVNNRVYNFIVCGQGVAGIGVMEIEDTFIVD